MLSLGSGKLIDKTKNINNSTMFWVSRIFETMSNAQTAIANE